MKNLILFSISAVLALHTTASIASPSAKSVKSERKLDFRNLEGAWDNNQCHQLIDNKWIEIPTESAMLHNGGVDYGSAIDALVTRTEPLSVAPMTVIKFKQQRAAGEPNQSFSSLSFYPTPSGLPDSIQISDLESVRVSEWSAAEDHPDIARSETHVSSDKIKYLETLTKAVSTFKPNPTPKIQLEAEIHLVSSKRLILTGYSADDGRTLSCSFVKRP